jgi:hypothetical protein
MKLDADAIKFGGLIHGFVDKQFKASLMEDENGSFCDMIYRKYQAAGSPKNKKQWLADELKQYFKCATHPPRWIGKLDVPSWPFVNGTPMVFIEQVEVPDNEVAKYVSYPRAMLYIFAGRKPVDDVPNGWMSVYRVIEQFPDL